MELGNDPGWGQHNSVNPTRRRHLALYRESG